MYFFHKNMPSINYLLVLTDSVGIFQHSIFGVPNPKHGYTTDDNARALILSVMLYEYTKDTKFLKLITRYLSFLLNAQNDEGKFKNFMDYNRNFIEKEGSEDCFGRCIWALGRTLISNHIPINILRTCKYMLEKAIVHLPTLVYLRPKAYSLIGLTYMNKKENVLQHIENLASAIVSTYKKNSDMNWHWYEDKLVYSNAIMPWSLVKAYKTLGRNELIEVATESINFLEKLTFKKNYFKPIGCKGWCTIGEKPAEYDEQPIEACETLLMYLDYYKITKNIKHLDNAFKCFYWYLGQNSKNLCVVNNDVGACYDGITKDGLNYNQGSESTISYGISLVEISRINLLLD